MGTYSGFLRLAGSLIVVFSLFSHVWAAENKTVCAYFFYGNGCPHCAKVEPAILEAEGKYPSLEVHRFEIYENGGNAMLLHLFFEKYGIEEGSRGVPIVVIGNTYLAGSGAIAENFEKEVASRLGQGSPCPETSTNGNLSSISGSEGLSGLRLDVAALFITATGAAAVDAINPCAIAVLIILLSSMLSRESREKAVKTGLAFTVSIYAVYFLFGLGLFHALQISGISYWFYKILGVFAIAVGLLNIKDFFWYGGGGFMMEIPRSWRPALKKLLESVTSPKGAFLMGFVVTLFELPCTGGPYLFMTGLLAQQATQAIAIPVLLYYNLVFVFPLIGIIMLAHMGLSSMKGIEKVRSENIRMLHLITGAIMLLLGLAVILGAI